MPRKRKSGSRKTLLFIDPIEESSYPVTETGYALLYRAWARAQDDDGQVFAVYPNTTLRTMVSGKQQIDQSNITVEAHLIENFWASPYSHFRAQRDAYCANSDVGSKPCHRESGPYEIALRDADIIVYRQESGTWPQRRRLLRALAAVESEVLVYLSPQLALDPKSSSKVLPSTIAPDSVPRSFSTAEVEGGAELKIEQALSFVRTELGTPDTFIAKPLRGDNGIGITALGHNPLHSEQYTDPRGGLSTLLSTYGDLIVQEYVPSVRVPPDIPDNELSKVAPERCDFGEIRFILVDGTIPRTREGGLIQVARRTPTATSLIADSGISYATSLSEIERSFLQSVGREYMRRGIYFGGGDLIRTPDVDRPFVFTDAARSVCGHAVVTGALNGEPYLIVDQVLNSIERHWIRQQASEIALAVA
ncbi:MAG: hypothetical protein AAFN74_02825 [Myxococcota bacterium]